MAGFAGETHVIHITWNEAIRTFVLKVLVM